MTELNELRSGDLIMKQDGEPFPSEKNALSQQGHWLDRGVDTSVTEIEGGGFALYVKGVRKPKRSKLGMRDILTYESVAGYVQRFVNDAGNRIRMFEDAGWEIVRGDSPIGDEYVGNSKLPGDAVVKPLRNGGRAVLMRKKKEWFDEDYAEKQKITDAKEQGLISKAQVDGLKPSSGRKEGIEISRPNR